MKILINCSNLKVGGGLQVADSVCRQLNRYPQHKFIVVLSTYLDKLAVDLKNDENVEVLSYTLERSVYTFLTKRDKYLDEIVARHKVECVLTIFGPSRWTPRVPHISGFARLHIVPGISPFFNTLQLKDRIKSFVLYRLVEREFRRNANYFYTENPYISDQLKKKWPDKHIETITNYYHQVFDESSKWKDINIPDFNGASLLTVSANYPHKNLKIAIEIARILKKKHKTFSFRFIYTVSSTDLYVPSYLKEHFLFVGKVDIAQCPKLYQMADISFQPSLLECFTATYPESMIMGVPIITTNLEFAEGLCGDAALYYPPLDAECAAEQIYRLATDVELRNRIILNGKERLKCFDNYEQRADKLISFCERVTKHKK